MDKDFLIQTTNNLYRLTLFFPKKEPLRYKMREIASDILANSNGQVMADFLLNELRILNDFFEVAKKQFWVSDSDVSMVQAAYMSLMQELENVTNIDRLSHQQFEQPEQKNQAPFKHLYISERQKKILELIKEKGSMQVHQIQPFFSELSKRTLRRDFEQLLNQGFIKRMGEGNEISYKIT